MSARSGDPFTRRDFLVTGGSGVAVAVAVTASARVGLGSAGTAVGPAGRLVAVGCCPVSETATNAEGRVHDADRVAGSLAHVGGPSALVSVLALRAAHGRCDADAQSRVGDLGDFATSLLKIHVAGPLGFDREVNLWGASAQPALSIAGPAHLEAAIGRGGVIALTLDVARPPSALTRRLRAAGRRQSPAAATEEEFDAPVRLTQRLDLPLRAGIYFLAGRRVGTGTLPSWETCRVQASPTDGALSLMTHGLGSPRPVDFPYLVLRVGHVATPHAIALG